MSILDGNIQRDLESSSALAESIFKSLGFRRDGIIGYDAPFQAVTWTATFSRRRADSDYTYMPNYVPSYAFSRNEAPWFFGCNITLHGIYGGAFTYIITPFDSQYKHIYTHDSEGVIDSVLELSSLVNKIKKAYGYTDMA